MPKGAKYGGRVKGTPNKLSMNIKEAFDYAFESIGGSQRLAEWAKDNTTDFYKIFSKMLPTNSTANVSIVSHEDRLEQIKEIERKALGK